MHTLFVLRHAKSSWRDPTLDDHQRPLAPRGRRAAKLLADHLRSARIEPDQILCSSSRRTIETIERALPSHQPLVERELYAASADQVLKRLRRIPERVGSVMVVGHNPAMHVLVLRLAAPDTAEQPDEQLAEVERKLPTGALATLTFGCAWSELGTGCAQLVSYVRPKSLA